jgi:hypothetical protein
MHSAPTTNPSREVHDGVQEGIGPARQIAVETDGAGMVENAHVHGPGMQVNAGVKCMGSIVQTHHGLLGLREGLEPASWLEGTSSLKIPR